MNGRVDYLVTEEEISLTRGPSGTCETGRLRAQGARGDGRAENSPAEPDSFGLGAGGPQPRGSPTTL